MWFFCSWLSRPKHVFRGSAIVIENSGANWKLMLPGCHGNASCFCLCTRQKHPRGWQDVIWASENKHPRPFHSLLIPTFFQTLSTTTCFSRGGDGGWCPPTADLPWMKHAPLGGRGGLHCPCQPPWGVKTYCVASLHVDVSDFSSYASLQDAESPALLACFLSYCHRKFPFLERELFFRERDIIFSDSWMMKENHLCLNRWCS